eukprot:EC718108.1.p1 GENE.EC718108.1~~EC718108.1.p1  ORF type:complete len:70 (+),score=11.94 EC718108.1:120-329(+)
MDETSQAIAAEIIARQEKNPDRKFIVAIAGVPGAGKSTFAHNVCDRINKMTAKECAVILPMDGFHYTRA